MNEEQENRRKCVTHTEIKFQNPNVQVDASGLTASGANIQGTCWRMSAMTHLHPEADLVGLEALLAKREHRLSYCAEKTLIRHCKLSQECINYSFYHKID